MSGRRAKQLRRRSAALADPESRPAELADCCLESLEGQWVAEQIITCRCGRPWTAMLVGDVASWWTP